MPSELQYATDALDFHRALTVPHGSVAASRADLNALHAHLFALYALLDVHTDRTSRTAPVEADHLRAGRIRIWQAADHLHAAYHAAPHPDGRLPTREACRSRLPEGGPELVLCQRHLDISALVRREHTPADLHAPFTGLIRH